MNRFPHFALLSAFILTSIIRSSALAQARPQAGDAIRIPFELVTLPNGLQVILAPDHSTPRVTVDIWYHVGSKNEVSGHTGFAHMFEHVMFTGSAHVPYGVQDRLTEGVGGDNNATTSEDRTNYYDNEPSNYLESALWIEADRMGFLLDKLDKAKFEAQRDIVQNERREAIDNQPYGRAWEIQNAALYPASNPYSWPVVGYISELQQATVEDVKDFFRLYYAPSNASLAIVGDFDPAQAKAWITKYFGDLPGGKPIVRAAITEPLLAADKRLVFEDRVQVPMLFMRWPTVGADSRDDKHALDVLAAILTGSRTARLTKALVYDAQSAASVSSRQSERERVGEFNIMISPRPGHSLTDLEAAADSVIDRLKREGPTQEEMAKAIAGLELGFVSGLEFNLAKANLLLEGLVFHGDAGDFRSEYEHVKSVTAADVKRMANTYLGRHRVVLSVVPLGKSDQAARPATSVKVTVSPDGGHYLMGGN